MSRIEKTAAPIALDWSRLLGFDQVVRQDGGEAPTLQDARLTKVGAKPCQVRNLSKVGRKAVLRSDPS